MVRFSFLLLYIALASDCTGACCRWTNFLAKSRQLYIVILADFQDDLAALGPRNRQQGCISFSMYKVRATRPLTMCPL